MPAQRAVMITGTLTGSGEACALLLDRLGFQVFAGVRKDADGEALRRKASPALQPVRIDILDANSESGKSRSDRHATLFLGSHHGLPHEAGARCPHGTASGFDRSQGATLRRQPARRTHDY